MTTEAMKEPSEGDLRYYCGSTVASRVQDPVSRFLVSSLPQIPRGMFFCRMIYEIRRR